MLRIRTESSREGRQIYWGGDEYRLNVLKNNELLFDYSSRVYLYTGTHKIVFTSRTY